MGTFNKPNTVQLDNDMEMLSAFERVLSLAQNPQPWLDAHAAVKAAHVEVQEAHKLSLDEQAKYKDAMDAIKQHADNLAAIEKEKSDFADVQAKHHSEVNAFIELREQEMAKLAKWADELTASEQALKSRESKMAEEAEELRSKFSAAMSPIDALKAQNERDKAANEQEAQRLAIISAKLKEKAKRTAEILADTE